LKSFVQGGAGRAGASAVERRRPPRPRHSPVPQDRPLHADTPGKAV